jgi:hypothetical protein
MDHKLPEGRGTHNAWFDHHIDDCVVEEVWVSRYNIIMQDNGWVGENVINCVQFCMSCGMGV